jgi:hypothetical protein
MKLKSISNTELRENTKKVVKKERLIGIEVLQHLKEIDSRKSYALWGYSNLYVYCAKELKYFRGSAHRRIASMKLLREVPDLELKIESGEVNVSTLSQVHGFFVQEERQLGKTYLMILAVSLVSVSAFAKPIPSKKLQFYKDAVRMALEENSVKCTFTPNSIRSSASCQ